jgi:hypothetical protein
MNARSFRPGSAVDHVDRVVVLPGPPFLSLFLPVFAAPLLAATDRGGAVVDDAAVTPQGDKYRG